MKVADLLESQYFQPDLEPHDIVDRIIAAHILKYCDKRFVVMYVDDTTYLHDDTLVADVYIVVKESDSAVSKMVDEDDPVMQKKMQDVKAKRQAKGIQMVTETQWELVKFFKSMPFLHFSGMRMRKKVYPADEIKKEDLVTHGVPEFIFDLTMDADMSEWNGKLLAGS